ncbi:MAG: trypsin-like peptidase domain-containing protein [Pleurocapsa sp. MO_192.B19]|nr:trypsin-like peptidase domain-containing protein [Pleurocapsa sp. MO_192.B19]
MTDRELDKLLQKCTVRLSVSGGHGTGFFVAPSLILTCAHVVGNSESSEVNAFWRETNQSYTTKIDKLLSDPNIDLALLQLINEIPDHPCIYFDQSNPQLDDRLYSFGYPDDNRDGDSITSGYEGESFRADSSLHKLKEGQFNYGSSGSPLLNRRTGGVCGIVIISRNPSNDLGGRAVSTSTIYDHLSELIDLQQQFHQRDVTWIKLLTLQQRQELIWKKSGRQQKNVPEGKWKNCTPNTEFIRPLAIDPNKPEYIYVGTSNCGYQDPANGIYRSTDSGQTWKLINNGLTNLDIHSLLVSTHDEKIYAGTDNGLFVSTTQGDAWARDEYFRGKDIRCIALSPHDENLVLCGTGRRGGASFSAGVLFTREVKKHESSSAGDFHLSRDGGSSWATISLQTVNGIAVSPQDKDIIYFGSGDDGLWKTSNGLITLDKVNNCVKRDIFCVAVSPKDDSHVLVGARSGLYISFDAGESWRNISEIGNIAIGSISFSPVESNRIFVTTTNGIFESQDDGQSWRASNEGLVHQWIMAVDISSNETVYVGTSGGGVYKREINQKKWQPCNLGFSREFVICSVVVRKNLIYAGSNPGVFRSHDEGKSWLLVNYFSEPVWSLAMPLVQSAYQKKVGGLSMSTNFGGTWQDSFITGNAPIYAGTTYGRIYKSEDAGFSWQLVGDLGGNEVYSLEISPHTTNIYAGIKGAGVFKSTDRGSSWTPLNEGLNDLQIECLTVSGGYNREILYCGTAKGFLYKSINGGESWQACGDDLPSQPIYSIAQSPTAIDLVYAATEDGLYKSCNGGLSWKFLDNNLGKQMVLSVLLSPLDSNLLYAGTKNGVFKSIDGGESWFFLGNEIDKKHFSDTNEVIRLVCLPENPSLIYAASQKGLFELVDS